MSTYNSDGSRADVQAKINLCVDGDTVTIPAGAFTWTSTVTISGKAIHLQGAGGGGFFANSATNLSVGTGSKAFTLVTEGALGADALLGVTVRATCKYDANTWMQGVISGRAGGSVTLSVSSSSGSGSNAFWVLAIVADTVITHSAGAANLIEATPRTTHYLEFSGIRFIEGSVSGETPQHIRINYTSGAKPPLIHNCWFSTSAGMLRSVEHANVNGVFWECSFDEDFTDNTDEGIVFKPLDDTTSWARVSSMGTADTNHDLNTYVEDCWFQSISYSAMDVDDNARVVIRNCVFDNTGFGSHGQDTSPYGMRHVEIYDNVFEFDDMGANTFNLNWWFYFRGGTGVITRNVMPDISSSAWGNKGEILLTVFSIQRGPTQIPCQTSYPASHQIGRGYVNGAGGAAGDLEPVYIWDNTGSPAVSVVDYGEDDCGNGLTAATFIQSGRDYYSSAKAGYTSASYPNTHRQYAGSGGGSPGSPSSAAYIGQKPTAATSLAAVIGSSRSKPAKA